MRIGETTPIDWEKILTGATTLATTYLGYRAATKTGAAQPTAPAPIVPAGPAPTGMSNTTKALLIGGGILAAGLIVYTITKKK